MCHGKSKMVIFVHWSATYLKYAGIEAQKTPFADRHRAF